MGKRKYVICTYNNGDKILLTYCRRCWRRDRCNDYQKVK